MNVFEFSKPLLIKIVENDIPFALVIRNSFKNENDLNFKKDCQGLIGCELRHHLLFSNLIQRFIGDIPFEKSVFLRFFLVNHLFLKKYNDSLISDLVKQDISNDSFDLLKSYIDSTPYLIDENLDKSSPAFLALRFNTPEWIIRMWQKQYGKGIVYKILKRNYHQPSICLRIDENKINKKEFLSSHPDYVESDIENILIYQNKGTPKNLEGLKNNSLFFMKMSTKYVLDKLNFDRFSKTVIYAGGQNNLYLELNARLGDQLDLDLIISHNQCYFDTKRIVEKFNLNKIKIYNTQGPSIVSCVSSPVDNVICAPQSTAFNLLRNTPDYFLRIKQEKLDEIIHGQSEALEECSKVLNKNGILTYMIPTLCKKESINVIGDFLSNHPEFELVEERQFFPFESYDSILYYAILKKVS